MPETKDQLADDYLLGVRDLDQAIQRVGKIPPARSGSLETGPFAT